MVVIRSAQWADGRWTVLATIEQAGASRSGPHVIEGPETMSEEDLIAAVAAVYQ